MRNLAQEEQDYNENQISWLSKLADAVGIEKARKWYIRSTHWGARVGMGAAWLIVFGSITAILAATATPFVAAPFLLLTMVALPLAFPEVAKGFMGFIATSAVLTAVLAAAKASFIPVMATGLLSLPALPYILTAVLSLAAVAAGVALIGGLGYGLYKGVQKIKRMNRANKYFDLMVDGRAEEAQALLVRERETANPNGHVAGGVAMAQQVAVAANNQAQGGPNQSGFVPARSSQRFAPQAQHPLQQRDASPREQLGGGYGTMAQEGLLSPSAAGQIPLHGAFQGVANGFGMASSSPPPTQESPEVHYVTAMPASAQRVSPNRYNNRSPSRSPSPVDSEDGQFVAHQPPTIPGLDALPTGTKSGFQGGRSSRQRNGASRR